MLICQHWWAALFKSTLDDLEIYLALRQLVLKNKFII